MDTVIELHDVKKTYHLGEIEVSSSNGVSFQVGHGEMDAIVEPRVSEKSPLTNSVGSLDAPVGGAYIFDDLKLSKMSDDEQAALRAMLGKLNHSLSISSALARDMLTFCEYPRK